jgi:hypothetical protein
MRPKPGGRLTQPHNGIVSGRLHSPRPDQLLRDGRATASDRRIDPTARFLFRPVSPTPPNQTWVSRSGADPKIQAASSGNSSFNDTWLTIRIKLPSTYGCSILSPCLQPTSGPGVALGGEKQQGWWKIEYQTTSAANDTTTWRVNLIGNPVHLVVP